MLYILYYAICELIHELKLWHSAKKLSQVTRRSLQCGRQGTHQGWDEY